MTLADNILELGYLVSPDGVEKIIYPNTLLLGDGREVTIRTMREGKTCYWLSEEKAPRGTYEPPIRNLHLLKGAEIYGAGGTNKHLYLEDIISHGKALMSETGPFLEILLINSEGTSSLDWLGYIGPDPVTVENPIFSNVWLHKMGYWLKEPEGFADSKYNRLGESSSSKEQRHKAVEFYIEYLEKILNYVRKEFPEKEGKVRKSLEALQDSYKDTFGELKDTRR